MGDGEITINDDVAASLNDTFDDYAKKFELTVEPVGAAHDSVISGCGEFSDKVETGVAKFLLGWRETLLVCGQTSGIIAANVMNQQLDLTEVDVDNTVTISIL